MTEARRVVVPPEEQGGDPVCWLERVCPACGRMRAAAGAACEECGHPGGE